MDKLQVFNSSEFGDVRTIIVNDNPMFCLSDVCRVLGIKNSRDAKSRLKEDGVGTTDIIDSLGRKQSADFINESNLYKLIFQSRKENAERFSDWVTSEVLPTIRKTGGYVNNDELFINTYFQFADDMTKEMLKGVFSTVRKQNEIIKEQQNTIEYKEDVIIGLTDEIDLEKRRAILNRVVRYKGSNYRERWSELYKHFEAKYHVNLNKRLENYNDSHSPKIKNKLDYIDKVMNKVNELYDIACKLYEGDIKVLCEELYGIV